MRVGVRGRSHEVRDEYTARDSSDAATLVTEIAFALTFLAASALGSPRVDEDPPKPASDVLQRAASRPVARFGTHEVTIGEIVDAALRFYPEARTELDTPYGEQFFDSPEMDGWIAAYLDLLTLARDPRSNGALPPKAAIDRAIEERAGSLQRAPNAPASSPAAPDEAARGRARRLYGFEAARQARLDELVPEIRDRNEVRRYVQAHPEEAIGRIRARFLDFSARDATGKRWPRARREQVRSDAERVLARLRAGEPFDDVERQVEHPSTSRPARPRETLRWIAYDGTPLPAPLLRALFRSKEDLVGPIETRDGYTIAKIEERARRAPLDFEAMADPLARQARRDAQLDLLESLRADVSIVVY